MYVQNKMNGNVWVVVVAAAASLFEDDTVLFAKSEEELERVVDEYSVCMRRKLKVNVGKSKVMVFE